MVQGSFLVCDTGSGSIKSGSALYPKVVVASLVGRPVVRDHVKYSRNIAGNDENLLDEYLVLRSVDDSKDSSHRFGGNQQRSLYIGTEAKENHSLLDISYPMKSGLIKNWEDMESVWSHVFRTAVTTPPVGGGASTSVLTPSNRQNKRRKKDDGISVKSIVLTETAQDVYKIQRERITETMFETFRFENVNLSSSAALVLAARGTTTGVVVDSGFDQTEITPVSNGFVQKGSCRKMDVGGRLITQRLIDLLKRSDGSNYRLDLERDFFMIEKIKEKFCYIPKNLAQERYIGDKTNCLSKLIELPDKTQVVLNKERFLAPEILFQPQFMGDSNSDSLGVCGMIEESISSCAIDLRTHFFKSIILSGGNSLMNGFGDRIRKELRSHSPLIDESPDRAFLAYQGGVITAESQTLDSDWWIKKSEYDEFGPSIVHRLFNI